MLAVGFTTVFNRSVSLKEFTALRAVAADDAAPFAHFYSTGPIVTVKGDFFGQMVGAPTPENAEEAQAAIKALKAAGVDAIKVQYDDVSWSMKQHFPVLKRDVLDAIIKEAHRQDLKVFAHAPMLKHAKEALRLGLDGLMHGIIDEPIDQEFAGLMKQNRASYVATMALFNDMVDVNAWARRVGLVGIPPGCSRPVSTNSSRVLRARSASTATSTTWRSPRSICRCRKDEPVDPAKPLQ